MENQKHFGDNFIAAMKNAAVELEEFQLQVALGKAEARDKAEEVRKKFNGLIHDAKLKIDKGGEKFKEMKGKLEHLEVQLALGKAEAKDAIAENKKKITRAIDELDTYLSKLYSE